MLKYVFSQPLDMLENLVEFSLVREHPSDLLIDKDLENRMGCGLGIVAGVVGAGIGALVLGPVGLLGAGLGFGANYLVHSETPRHNARKKATFDVLETNKDDQCRRTGAPVAAFSYKGKSVDCVLREAYQRTGHTFHFRLSEPVPVIGDVRFLYMPKGERMKFYFNVLNVRQKLAVVCSNKTVKAVRPEILPFTELCREEKVYLDRFAKAVKGELEKYGGTDFHFTLKYAKTLPHVRFEVSCEGSQFKYAIAQFAKACSGIMELASTYDWAKVAA